MKTKTFRSSSAAYRSIRQFETKNGKNEKEVIVDKIEDKLYLRIVKNGELTYPKFLEETPTVTINNKTFKYFEDGSNGEGYYELKTGDRRRPNSTFINMVGVYIPLQEGTATIK